MKTNTIFHYALTDEERNAAVSKGLIVYPEPIIRASGAPRKAYVKQDGLIWPEFYKMKPGGSITLPVPRREGKTLKQDANRMASAFSSMALKRGLGHSRTLHAATSTMTLHLHTSAR
jgi:hypothetical protein